MNEPCLQRTTYFTLAILLLTSVIGVTELIIHIRRSITLHTLQNDPALWIYLSVYIVTIICAFFFYTTHSSLWQRMYMVASSISLGLLMKELYLIAGISSGTILLFHIALCCLNCLCLVLAWNSIKEQIPT